MEMLAKSFLCYCFWSIAVTYSLQAQNPVSVGEGNLPDSIPAHFKGGQFAWQMFLAKNQKIPEFFMKKGGNLSVTCKVQFIIDTSGQVSDVKITQPGCCGTDEEAVRVIKASDGYWSPATIHGKPVKYNFIQPFIFQIEIDGDDSEYLSLDELRSRYDKWIRKQLKSQNGKTPK